MYCYVCNNKFYIKRDFYSLFETKKKYICNRCYNENPINPNLELLECDNGDVVIVNLLKRKIKYSYDVYINELSFIVKRYIYDSDYFVVFLEELYLSISMIEIINWLAKGSEKKLIILCFLKLN